MQESHTDIPRNKQCAISPFAIKAGALKMRRQHTRMPLEIISRLKRIKLTGCGHIAQINREIGRRNGLTKRIRKALACQARARQMQLKPRLIERIKKRQAKNMIVMQMAEENGDRWQ